jgi:signal transduction histidine kinase
MFVRPKFQLKLSLYFLVVGTSIITPVSLFILHMNKTVVDLMNNNTRIDFHTQIQMNELMAQCFQVALLGFLVFIILSFVFALVMSHRIAGPQVAIQAYIAALKAGDYDYQRSLRPRDELTEIMAALKDLNPVLKARDKNL